MLDFKRSLSYVSACSESDVKYAVDVQNIVFGYKKNTKVINKLTIRIVEGKIFALLGSNGSGKTTLLKLILGRLKPRSGIIRIFGNQPGAGHSDIPGPGAGYVPQENGLFPELTIEENLIYYSVLYQMNKSEAELRIKEFTELWNLPERDKLIEDLSKDQQKLVSLGISLIHRPRLLILDEPTIGADSEIRYRIWDRLEVMCKEFGTTVIITSHYVEEVKNAHTVGFAYSGKCLKYSAPDELMRQYRCSTLEGVYYELVRNFIAKSKESFKYVLEEEENKFIRIQNILSKRESEDKLKVNPLIKSLNLQHIKALMCRSGISIKRRPNMFVAYLLVPIILICLLNLCFGRPRNIPIAIYNPEATPTLSKAFVDRLDDRLFRKTHFLSNDSSFESVVNGQNYLSLVFSENFTENTYHRLLEPNILTEEGLDNIRIKLYADLSNPIIGYFTQIQIIQTFHNLIDMFWHLIGRNPGVLSLPFELHGQFEGSYDHFLCPGLVLACIQFLNILITTFYAFNLIDKRKATFPDRSLVAGVTDFELLIAQSLLVSVFIICQSLIVTIMLLLVYPVNGNVMDVLLLLILQGIQGMTFGTSIALLFNTFTSSAYAIGLTIIPLWLTSGILWPLESAPTYVQNMGPNTPLGASTQSLRLIMFKGWTLFNSFQLICGYLKLMAYIIVFSIINKFLIKNI